ncbi:MAG: S-layer homology domain-containing protein, partial [Oscillospiraceae bacterium]|nr:S-layer homology domain-containing protein [Oscillospiraceae bacterium]
MRTLKKALSLVLVLALLCSVCVFSASASNFSDDADIEYTEAVDVLVQIGVIDGMGDGTFNPNGNLTRAQAAKIICYLLLGADTNKLEASTQNSTFTDVIGSGHDWASPYIEYCVNAGIVGGYGDGRFGPGDQLTGFQFGKMLLCALGYDAAIEGYTGSAWTVAVASDIIDADLDDGLPGGFNYNAPLTREEACQMAFNTLKANMVEYATKGTTIVTGDGTTVVTGASTADPKINTKNTDGNIDGTTGEGHPDGIMQFAEYYFQDLKLTEGHEDDFGRPSNTWKDGTTEIGTYTDKTDLVATYDGKVTKGTLYNLIGKSNVKDLKDAKSDLTVFVDGVAYENTDDIDAYFNSGDSSTFASLLKDGSKMGEGHGGNFIDATGNGSKTEVYQDKDNNVTIVVINEYLVKAAGDYNETKDELKVDLVNVDDINEYTPAAIALDDNALSADDFPAVAKGAEDDYFVVTMAAVDNTYNGKFEVKSAEPAKLVKGNVDTFTQNLFKVEFGTVTLDGSAYNYGLLAAWHDGYEAAYSIGEAAVVVTDSKGFILYVDDAVAVDKYVFVYEFGSDSATLSRLSQDKADAFFIDGTDAVITVDTVKDANKEKIADPQPGWYSYSVGSDGKYK